MPDEPPFNSECAGCTALSVALADALRLLSIVDADANNIQLDIARLRRRYHAEVAAAENGLMADG